MKNGIDTAPPAPGENSGVDSMRKVWETNPLSAGETYRSPLDGGIVPTPRAIILAKTLTKRFGVELEGGGLDPYVLELARFCEAESGLPQQVEAMQRAADFILKDEPIFREAAGGRTSPAIVLPLRGGGEVAVAISPRGAHARSCAAPNSARTGASSWPPLAEPWGRSTSRRRRTDERQGRRCGKCGRLVNLDSGCRGCPKGGG